MDIRKTWRQWPQSRRTQAIIGVGLLGITALLTLVLFVLPALMVSGDDVPNTVDRLKAQNDIRGTLTQTLAGLALLLGASLTALFSARTIRLNREGQITDRFTKAIAQLGDKNLDVRLGGIHALERIAQESPRDHWPIMEVLTAFLREHFRAPDAGTDDSRPRVEQAAPPADAQAVLTVLGRRSRPREPFQEPRPLDLRRTDFRRADLSEAHLERAIFSGAHLEEAYLTAAHLEGALLRKAHLEEAYLIAAHLEGANLSEAHLERAVLYGAHLEGANLGEAHLEGADLREAHLEGATFSGILGKATSDQETLWPSEFDSAEAGVRQAGTRQSPDSPVS